MDVGFPYVAMVIGIPLVLLHECVLPLADDVNTIPSQHSQLTGLAATPCCILVAVHTVTVPKPITVCTALTTNVICRVGMSLLRRRDVHQVISFQGNVGNQTLSNIPVKL